MSLILLDEVGCEFVCFIIVPHIILEKAVESTASHYCTDSQTLFSDFSPHRMGDTVSVKNQKKESVNQCSSDSRYDSTAFSRIIHWSYYNI